MSGCLFMVVVGWFCHWWLVLFGGISLRNGVIISTENTCVIISRCHISRIAVRTNWNNQTGKTFTVSKISCVKKKIKFLLMWSSVVTSLELEHREKRGLFFASVFHKLENQQSFFSSLAFFELAYFLGRCFILKKVKNINWSYRLKFWVLLKGAENRSTDSGGRMEGEKKKRSFSFTSTWMWLRLPWWCLL